MERLPLPFSELRPPLDRSAITQFEERWKVRIPEPYKAFLLRANGAELALPIFHYRMSPKGRVREGSIHTLLSINHEDEFKNLSYYVDTYMVWSRRIPYDLFPIGSDGSGDLVLMGDEGPRLGRIYYWFHELESSDGEPPTEENVYFVANTLDEFLANLKPFLMAVD